MGTQATGKRDTTYCLVFAVFYFYPNPNRSLCIFFKLRNISEDISLISTNVIFFSTPKSDFDSGLCELFSNCYFI
jgi:hypothetical protein